MSQQRLCVERQRLQRRDDEPDRLLSGWKRQLHDNWPEYGRSLVRRGDVTLWLSLTAAASWNARPSGRRGGQPEYSDLAIETALTLRLVFHLPLRQAEGFLGSLFEIIDALAPISQAAVYGTCAQERTRQTLLGKHPDLAAEVTDRRCTRYLGFSLHADVRISQLCPDRLERLVRYVARGPICNDRLELDDDGMVVYKFKREWKNSSRLQVLQTTHSPVFTMASETGFWVELQTKNSRFVSQPIPQLTRSAESRGVSGWIHPVLAFPWNPVVLVEGHTDVEALSHVARAVGLHELRFMELPTLDPSEKGAGADNIIRYVRAHSKLIHNRPDNAPFIVLFDWDVPDQSLEKTRRAYGDGASQRVLRMDPAACAPELGKSFKGIERFYPPRIVQEAHAAGEIAVAFPTGGGAWSLAKDELSRSKRRLLERFRQVHDQAELHPLIVTLTRVDRAARGEHGVQLTLPGLGAGNA